MFFENLIFVISYSHYENLVESNKSDFCEIYMVTYIYITVHKTRWTNKQQKKWKSGPTCMILHEVSCGIRTKTVHNVWS